MMQRGDVDAFYSITLFPSGNHHFHEELPKYTSRLTDESNSYVAGCTFEQFIEAISGTPEFDEWRAWLEKRYLITNV